MPLDVVNELFIIQMMCCQEHMVEELRWLRRIIEFGEGPQFRYRELNWDYERQRSWNT